MSQSIWTRCGGKRNARRLQVVGWRVVEAQHAVSTRKLVDSNAEQELLEELIDQAKPPISLVGKKQLHYLLFTPFRYPPLRHGSRFGVKTEPGIFYGALTVQTCLAEVAYYRLAFLEGTSAELSLLQTQHTAFRFSIRTSNGVNLTRAPFSRYAASISSPSNYGHSQKLGQQMREDGIDACLYTSARDPQNGEGLALFSPVFGMNKPYPDWQTWNCAATKSAIEMKRLGEKALVFERALFLVNGSLPMPAI